MKLLELGPTIQSTLRTVFHAPIGCSIKLKVSNYFLSPKSQSLLYPVNKHRDQACHKNTPVPNTNFCLSQCFIVVTRYHDQLL